MRNSTRIHHDIADGNLDCEDGLTCHQNVCRAEGNLFCNADADCDGEKVCVPWLGINDAITVNGNTVIKACSLPRNLDEYCINGQHNHCNGENLCGQNFQVAAIAQDYGKCQKPIDYCNSSNLPPVYSYASETPPKTFDPETQICVANEKFFSPVTDDAPDCFNERKMIASHTILWKRLSAGQSFN